MCKALVVSGGGAKGAFAGGIVQHLIDSCGYNYDILVGTSTGSLLIPLIAIEDLDKLKHAYTHVTTSDIFKINPFKVSIKPNGDVKIGINYWNVFRNIFLRRQKSFGDSSNLRKTIQKFITQDDYNKILESDKNVTVCTVNITLGEKEYKSIKDPGMSYSDFCDWLYISACAPPFMSVNTKDGYEYTDGGVLENTPIQEAIDQGATEIDAIFLRPETGFYKIEKIRNVFHLIIKTIDVMSYGINRDDIQIGKLKAKDRDVKLNVYYTPRSLTNNSLIFNKQIMHGWWDEGYQIAKQKYYKSFILRKRKKAKLIYNGLINQLSDQSNI